ncbi:MAG TPA: MFS transporter [Anaerolineaceae bacterium]
MKIPLTFRALRHRNYRIWFFGQTISLVGTWMQTMAQQVLVYRLTGSAGALGTVNFLALVPLIPLSLWGGSLTDRIPKRNVILTTQALMMIQALMLAFLTWKGIVQVWHVYLLAFFLGAVNAVDVPARQAFTVDMVEGKEDLTNAIGLNSAMFNGARALGPALAGAVVATTGEGTAFFLNAVTFVAVILCLLFMRNLPKPVERMLGRGQILRHMGQGWRFVIGEQSILVLFSLVGLSAFLSMPYMTLMPVFADQVLGKSASPVITYLCSGDNPLLRCQSPEALPLGLLLTMVGVGAVIGALVVASLPGHASRGKWMTFGSIGFPLALVIYSLSRSFVLSMLLLLLAGFCFVWQNTLANTLIQILAPDHLRGRIMSLYSMITQGMMRLGGLQAGLVADWIGAPLSLGIGALISLVYDTYVAFRYPKVRKI